MSECLKKGDCVNVGERRRDDRETVDVGDLDVRWHELAIAGQGHADAGDVDFGADQGDEHVLRQVAVRERHDHRVGFGA